jgi:hypothetical protein
MRDESKAHRICAPGRGAHQLSLIPRVPAIASGHGAYPFWLGPSGQGGHGALEVWWSQSKAADKFYHASCGMREAGYSKNVPCYHLFTGKADNPKAYLYTATEDFCCISEPGERWLGAGWVLGGCCVRP